MKQKPETEIRITRRELLMASIDMVYSLPDAELHDLRERIKSREGLHQLEHMRTMGMGDGRYRLVAV